LLEGLSGCVHSFRHILLPFNLNSLFSFYFEACKIFLSRTQDRRIFFLGLLTLENFHSENICMMP
jgi:hypothetical protein